MFCLECGEAIPDGSVTCPKCGAAIKKTFDESNDEQAVVYASQSSDRADEEILQKTPFYKKIPNLVCIVIAVVVCIVVIFFIVNTMNKATLKQELVKEWYDTDGSIIKVLDIDDDKIEYRIETGYLWMDTSLGTYDWKPAGKNKIKIQRFNDSYETFTIEFDDDKTSFMIRPAITSVDDNERWYHLD